MFCRHQTGMCELKPDVVFDLTPVFETKVAAELDVEYVNE